MCPALQFLNGCSLLNLLKAHPEHAQVRSWPRNQREFLQIFLYPIIQIQLYISPHPHPPPQWDTHFLLGPIPCTSFGEIASRGKLGKCRDHLACPLSIRDRSQPTLAAVECLQTAVTYFLLRTYSCLPKMIQPYNQRPLPSRKFLPLGFKKLRLSKLKRWVSKRPWSYVWTQRSYPAS